MAILKNSSDAAAENAKPAANSAPKLLFDVREEAARLSLFHNLKIGVALPISTTLPDGNSMRSADVGFSCSGNVMRKTTPARQWLQDLFRKCLTAPRHRTQIGVCRHTTQIICD